jgi:hypothetical protein
VRQPWIQVAMELIEVSAPELSIELAISEGEAGWMLTKLIPWALARCPEHMPPSESDVVEGASAARKIAKAVGWSGDPDEFVNACLRLRYAPLQLVPGGIRIRGLDRYDSGWGSNHRELWADWKSFREGTGVRPGSQVNPSVNTKGKHCPDPDADADADDQPPPPSEPADQTNWVAVVDEYWKPFGAARVAAGFEPEAGMPKGFLPWVKARRAEGFTPRDVGAAYADFLVAPGIKAKGRPAAVFLEKGCWSSRLKKLPPPPPPPSPLRVELDARLEAISQADGYAAVQLRELEPIGLVGGVLQLRAATTGAEAWVREHYQAHLTSARLELLPKTEVRQ